METPPSNEEILFNIACHVFLPPRLPQQALERHVEHQVHHRLVLLAREAVARYQKLDLLNPTQWTQVSKMLSHLAQSVENSVAKRQLEQNLTEMGIGEMIALYIREQNAAVIVRKSDTTTTFEIFEVHTSNHSTMSVPGKIVRVFPEKAVQVPAATRDDLSFIEVIANFLSRMNVDVIKDALPHTTKGGEELPETRDTANPVYISGLFFGFLRGLGEEIEPHRVTKRIGDEVLWDNALLPWRRSPIWLIIRVAVQTSLDSVAAYKHFMIYFLSFLLDECSRIPTFSSDLLFSMRAKLAHRLMKAQASVSEPIIQFVKDVSDRTEELLQARWSDIQLQAPKFGPLDLDVHCGKSRR